MSNRVTIIQGHPDPVGNHFGHALADRYVRAAQKAGHEVRIVTVAAIDFIGMVEMPNPAKRQKWLDRMSRYGERAG